MTYFVERLAALRRHLDHLCALRPRVTGREALDGLDPVERFFEIVRRGAEEEAG